MNTSSPHSDALERTDEALAKGMTGITPTTALGLIDHWQSMCADAGLDAIASGLTDLGGHLRADRLDGRAIGATLRSLATQTAEAASGDDTVASRLHSISAGLERGASMLGA